MRRTEMLQEIRKMRFEEVYFGWTENRLTQEEAARILGVCDRTFRRCLDRYEQGGKSVDNQQRGKTLRRNQCRWFAWEESGIPEMPVPDPWEPVNGEEAQP